LLISTSIPAFNQTNADTSDCSDKKEKDKPCKVDLAAFHPCTAAKNYGYEAGQPCIFLKLNKIYNWNPEYYGEKDTLPEKMPSQLKSHLQDRINSRKSLEVVWVSCEGENPADIENLGSNIEFKSLTGEQGFHGNYFPFMSEKGYLQPLVAVQFKSIKREFFEL
jgi:sodium/potassium-transporting ATPase subunit beta